MTETKFTTGPWRRTYTVIPNTTEGYDTSPEIINVTIGDWNIPLGVACYKGATAETAKRHNEIAANAALIAASPEMYDSEEKNLSMLKVILEGYEAMAGVVLGDPDLKATIEDGTLARQLPCAMPDAIGEIIMELKMRITETETLLAKARGEE